MMEKVHDSLRLLLVLITAYLLELGHHGMICVPVGYTFGVGLFEMEKVKGGSTYGASAFAGDGSRLPSEIELEQAFHQGKYFAGIIKKLK